MAGEIWDGESKEEMRNKCSDRSMEWTFPDRPTDLQTEQTEMSVHREYILPMINGKQIDKIINDDEEKDDIDRRTCQKDHAVRQCS